MPTTSRPARPAQGKAPIKGIRLKVRLAPSGSLAELAKQKGLSVEQARGALSVSFTAATPDEALEKLRLLSSVLAPKT